MTKSIALAALILIFGGTALAQGNLHNAVTAAQRVGPTKPAKVVSKSRQPVGTPHKASSFAPHRTNKRVYGDPIQAPIVHSHPAPERK